MKREAGKTQGYTGKRSKEEYNITFIEDDNCMINDGNRRVCLRHESYTAVRRFGCIQQFVRTAAQPFGHTGLLIILGDF